jgi:hypothetical protein
MRVEMNSKREKENQHYIGEENEKQANERLKEQ